MSSSVAAAALAAAAAAASVSLGVRSSSSHFSSNMTTDIGGNDNNNNNNNNEGATTASTPTSLGRHGSIGNNSSYTSRSPDGLVTQPNSVEPWLTENYEPCEGVSLPRSDLYANYMAYCDRHKCKPVNAASFGKLIRAVFPDLKTRRLGTRGNSKYHYYGISVKGQGSLGGVPGNVRTTKKARIGGSSSVSGGGGNGGRECAGSEKSGSHDTMDTTVQLPGIPLPLNVALPSTVSIKTFKQFTAAYRTHCQVLANTLYCAQFDDVSALVQTFWGSSLVRSEESFIMLDCEQVISWVVANDQGLYSTMLGVMLPDVFQALPTSLTHAIRSFAKEFADVLVAALRGLPKTLSSQKHHVGSMFSRVLRRHTSLNHLAQAFQAVQVSPDNLWQMHTDWARLDFTGIRGQLCWASRDTCSFAEIMEMETEFADLLRRNAPVEEWLHWMDNILESRLPTSLQIPSVAVSPTTAALTGSLKMSPEASVTKVQALEESIRAFMLHWSFFCSLVMRDLTLRSAASFGSFHLLRLLLDEFISLWCERRYTTLVFPYTEQCNYHSSAASSETYIRSVGDDEYGSEGGGGN